MVICEIDDFRRIGDELGEERAVVPNDDDLVEEGPQGLGCFLAHGFVRQREMGCLHLFPVPFEQDRMGQDLRLFHSTQPRKAVFEISLLSLPFIEHAEQRVAHCALGEVTGDVLDLEIENRDLSLQPRTVGILARAETFDLLGEFDGEKFGHLRRQKAFANYGEGCLLDD
ncbi:hypothetical protein [Erythrobacter sp. 3-20A1M]|uniref:hypothetical protein n=1 Tax=Erythrobacter sp. 3-20A1M TaxID=2653850 RepID=UPI00203CCBB8|nr:hypothetical protein [Erythrobacter sp. 3-20A1M]